MASMHPSDSLNVARTDCLPLKSAVNVLGSEIPFVCSVSSFRSIFFSHQMILVYHYFILIIFKNNAIKIISYYLDNKEIVFIVFKNLG
jgi:hypothetical protein